MIVFVDVKPCSLTEIYRRFRDACCPHNEANVRTDDGDSKNLWNVSKFLPHYKSQHPGRQSNSFLPPLEPEISQTRQTYCKTEMRLTGASRIYKTDLSRK
jgi:hypothetical protein